MTIRDCPNCGGDHWGSNVCPLDMTSEELRHIARKLTTYADIYTGDKEARCMAKRCWDVAALLDAAHEWRKAAALVPKAGDGVPEIEITPEMAEAGAEALEGADIWPPDRRLDWAMEVYRAMAALDLSRRNPSPASLLQDFPNTFLETIAPELSSLVDNVIAVLFERNPTRFLKAHYVSVVGTEQSLVRFEFDALAFQVAFDAEFFAALRTMRFEYVESGGDRT
jgi:hypothetical protein